MLIATPVQAIARPEESGAAPADAGGFADVLSTVTAQVLPQAPVPASATPASALPPGRLLIADTGIAPQETEGLLPASQQAPALAEAGLPEVAPMPEPVADMQAQSLPSRPAAPRPQANDISPADSSESAASPAIPASAAAQSFAAQSAPSGVAATVTEPVSPRMEGRPKSKSVAPSHDKTRADMGEPVASAVVAAPPMLALETQAKPLAVSLAGPVFSQSQEAETEPSSAGPSAISAQSPAVSRLEGAASTPPALGAKPAFDGQEEPRRETLPEPATAQESSAGPQSSGEGLDDSGALMLPRSAFETKLSQMSGPSFVQARSAPAAQSAFGNVYPPQAAGPVIDGRPGVAGRAMGVEIARAIGRGRDEMIVRLSPENLGRVEVRIAFDSEGALQAVLSTDQPATTALLQREAPNLVRALADAGIRSDDSSVRFQTPADGGQSGAWSGDRNQGSRQGRNQQGGQSGDEEYPVRSFRAIRAGSRVDLIA